MDHRGQRLPAEPRLDHGLGHAAPPRRRTRLGRAQFHPAADLRHFYRGRRREARPQRGRHRGGEGQAREDQAGLRGLDLDRHGAGRPSREDLQRALQQPRAAALRRVASDDPRRVQRHKILRAPEARHLAHSLGRLDLCRSRRRRREDLHPRRRGHGAETARPHHEADDDRARALPRAGGAGVPAALPDRQYPRRRRDQFREGQASALPRPSRDGELGLHHHHPFGVQVHPRARRLRTRAHLGRDRLLRRPSRSGRLRGPRLAKAHRADEGGHGGEARGAESPQGRPA